MGEKAKAIDGHEYEFDKKNRRCLLIHNVSISYSLG